MALILPLSLVLLLQKEGGRQSLEGVWSWRLNLSGGVVVGGPQARLGAWKAAR